MRNNNFINLINKNTREYLRYMSSYIKDTLSDGDFVAASQRLQDLRQQFGGNSKEIIYLNHLLTNP